MADAPSTANYLLMSLDSSLPNGQQLAATNGLQLQSGGSGGTAILSPTGVLASLQSLSSAGLVVYNSVDGEVLSVVFQHDSSIYIDNAVGTGGDPLIGVVPQTTIQLIKASANGGSSVGAYPELHFTGTGSSSCSVSADPANNRILVNYNSPLEGSGTVTSIGLVSPDSTINIANTPITTSGNIQVDLPTTGVVAGSYTSTNLTIDEYGRILVAANGSGGGGGVDWSTFPALQNVDMDGFSITNLADPTADADAIPSLYADNRFGIKAQSNTWSALNTFSSDLALPGNTEVVTWANGYGDGYVLTTDASGRITASAPIPGLNAFVQTTDATPTTWLSIAIPTDETCAIQGYLSANVMTFDKDFQCQFFIGARADSSGIASVIGDPWISIISDNNALDFSVTTSGGNVLLQVTGLAGETFSWNGYYSTIFI